MVSKLLIKQGADKRAAIVKYIAEYISKMGVSPTVLEIRNGVGLSSNSITHHHLRTLREGGVITWYDGLARTIRLVDEQSTEKTKQQQI